MFRPFFSVEPAMHVRKWLAFFLKNGIIRIGKVAEGMTKTNENGLYTAFKAKDTRFDGRFFIGVSSTKIYCRPVCRAKLPKAENCTFFPTAAMAEHAGYRPCLLCRPELAPGVSVTDASTSLAHKAARLLEENCGNEQSIEKLAEQLGYTDRHLRRVFGTEYHVSPLQHLQTCRLLLAKNLLTDTGLSVLDIAMAAGFGSLRRFNDLFKKQYKLSPGTLRKQATQGDSPSANVSLSLGYRPPYIWRQMLSFLAGRAIAGVEVVQDGKYFRTVRILTSENKQISGWIRVGNNPDKNALSVTPSQELLPVLPQVLARIRYLFDTHCDPLAISETLDSMNDIRPGIAVPGRRLPGCFDPYELAVRAVLGQQVTVKAASTLAARLTSTFGYPVKTGIEGLDHLFPRPEDIAVLGDDICDRLGPLGITTARAKAILSLSRAFIEGTVGFGLNADPEREIEKLTDRKSVV